MKLLININEAPYESENVYNALRIAMQFQKDDEKAKIRIYLLADGVLCAIRNDKTPAGFYNIETMMGTIIQKGGVVKMCTSCGEARGMKDLKLIDGVEWTNLKTLTYWIADSDKVLNY